MEFNSWPLCVYYYLISYPHVQPTTLFLFARCHSSSSLYLAFSLFLAPFCLLTNCWHHSFLYYFLFLSVPLSLRAFYFLSPQSTGKPTKELKSFPFLFSNKLKQPRRKIAKRSAAFTYTHKTKQTLLRESAESNLFVRQLCGLRS